VVGGLRHLARARRDAEVAVFDDGAERIELPGPHESFDVEPFRARISRDSANRFAQLAHRPFDARETDLARTC
jgi:hypothetical protein